MALPKCAMKRRLIVCLVMILALVAGLASTAAAEAEVDSLKVSIELSSSKLAEPKEITVSIQVTNTGDADMPGPVTLYDPSGKMVEEFGSPTLTAGASKSWSGKWNVTQSQLDSGKLTFKLKYSLYNAAGELVNKTYNFSHPLTYTGAVTSVEINRTITPTTARKGQTVSVTYDIINTGNVDITDVSIKEDKSISSKSGTIASVPAGEKGSYTFTVTMGTKDLTSQATITYKAGGKTQTEKKDAATIKYGEVKLTAALSASKKGGVPGDTVKLTLTLKNTGSADYQNVTVSDAVLGELFTGQTVPAGQTVTLEKDITITDSADYQFTVTGQDASGENVETATDRVSVKAVDPAKQVVLQVDASADRETVYTLPGTVKFRVTVTNVSAVDVSDVAVYASGVQLYSFPSILAGESRDFTRDVSVSMAGQYRFDAKVKNQLNETETFESNIIHIAFAQPTPEPTDAPIVTPPMPTYEDIPTDDGLPAYVDTVQRALGIAYRVLLVLAAICLLLLAIGVVRRMQAIHESNKAQDHLERGSYRDYTQPAPKGREEKKSSRKDEPVARPIGEDKEEPALPDAADTSKTVEDGELMAETLAKLYPNGDGKLTVDPTLTVEGEEPAEEPVPAPQEAETSADEAPAAEDAPVRHRRSQRHQDE